MHYVLYGAFGSGSTVVEATLTELEIAYRFERLDLRQQAQRESSYAALNPQQKVPTLVTPHGETLTESSAIVLTLAERHPHPPLLPPQGTSERAFALRWLMFAASELYPVIEIVDYPERFGPESVREEIKARALAHWRERWGRLEHAVRGPYFLDESFSLLDIYVAVLSSWDLPPNYRAEHLPKIEAIRNAVASRPSLVDVWRRNFPPKT